MDATGANDLLFAALKSLQENPERHARGRKQPNEPPLYPSRETTQSPSPPRSPQPLSEFKQRVRLRHLTPWEQFNHQCQTER